MRFGRFDAAGRVFHGELDDEVVHELDRAPWLHGSRTGDVHDLTSLAFLPPSMPPTFYAAGFNYAGHNTTHAKLGYTPVVVADHPEVGYRANSALVGHGSAIIKPSDVVGRFETEAEVVAVIGRDLRRVSRDEARDGVFGWTIGNDVSAREWQHADRTLWRSKNSDTFKPMGPWIETDVDPLASTTIVRVNGSDVASFATGAMIFDPFDFIVEISKYITMRPGDVLWMGADGATAIAEGDSVDIEISGVGTLHNDVTPEPQP